MLILDRLTDRSFATLATTALVATLCLGARNAAATSTSDRLVGSLPASGAVHPAGAPILFHATGEGPFELTVLVENRRAEVVTANTEVGRLYRGVASPFYDTEVRIEPAPQPGERVLIKGRFCEWCLEEKLAFTVGEALTPPAPPVVKLDKVQFTNCGASDCFPEYNLEVDGAGGRSSGLPLVHLVTQSNLAGLEPSPLAQPETVPASQDGSAGNTLEALEALCFRVETLDLSGNRSEPVETCGDPVRTVDFETYYHNPGSSGCTVAGPGRGDAGPPAASGLMLLALALLLRRRGIESAAVPR